MAKINLNRTYHPNSYWEGILEPVEELSYDHAVWQWRFAQPPSVIEDLAAEYKRLRRDGIPHEDIDPACWDGYLEYARRWPVKSKAMRSSIDELNAVSERLYMVQPNDEVDKGNEAIEALPDELLDRNDDSMIGRMIDEHADSMN